MRKNKFAFKNLKLFSTYEVRGLNLDAFINSLKNRGLSLYDVKKTGNKRLILTVNFFENPKFFAIAKDLCYTDIRKIKDGGRAYPLLYFFRNLGLILGAVFFIAAAVVTGDCVFSFSYTGSGSVLKRETENYLKRNGITAFTRFSDINLSSLADGILADNPRLSFVECERSGNRLIIESALSEGKSNVLSGNQKELLAECDGKVVSVKVYRGTPAVAAGDEVKKGDVLVQGTAIIKEQPVFVGVIAYVTILTEESYAYISDNAGEEDKAVIFAEESAGTESENARVSVSEENGSYIYTVTLECKRVHFTG